MTRLAFIGGGNMATAIIGGLRAAPGATPSIVAADPQPTARAALGQLGVETTDDNQAAATGADAVILAVKPQILPAVCVALREVLATTPAPLLISIAAGIPTALLEATLGTLPIVRCMPNTPALIGRGITALVANPRVSAMQRQLADNVMQAAGTTVWMDREEDLDAVTAVSGSGPAYVFTLLEALEDAGTALGLTAPVARQLAVATVAGAGELAYRSDRGPGALRQQVTSPGGTTAAALEEFQNRDFSGIVGAAVTAAHRRSIELGEAARPQTGGD